MLCSQEEKIIILGDKRVSSLVSDTISLVLKGEYSFSSTLQNKVLFLFLGQFITPSIGNRIALLFRDTLSHMDENDVRQDLYFIILQLINKYNPDKKRKKKAPLSIYGYISVMFPYMIKMLIEKYMLVYYREESLNGFYYDNVDLDSSTIDSLFDKSLSTMIKLLCDDIGFTSTELSNMWLINAVSVRRRKSK